ncbi:MAG: sigma-70 family RNA polymerase sigma factor [Patescibacteria group bacterium]
MTECRLWREYGRTRSVELRNKIIEHYLPLADVVARRLAGRLPRRWQIEHLVSSAQWGLIRAVESFDINRGATFSSYGSRVMRGAIVDELRALDRTRAIRKKVSFVPDVTRLDLRGRNEMLEEFLDSDADPLIDQVVTILAETPAVVLILYYYHDYTLAQIGRFISRSEPQVHRIRKRALLILREYFCSRRG